MGRPSSYTQELADEIVTRLSGGEPLAQICRDPHMPSDWTVRQWADANRPFTDTDEDGVESVISFALAYARARDAGEEVIVADCMEIIDTSPERVITTSGEDRVESRIDSASVKWLQNRAEMRLKLLAVWNPKKYGAKVDVTSGGDKLDGGMVSWLDAREPVAR